MIVSLRRTAVTMIFLAALPSAAAAQQVRGVIVDQTGLPLPGVTIDILEGALEGVLEAHARSVERSRVNGEDLVTARVVIMQFLIGRESAVAD